MGKYIDGANKIYLSGNPNIEKAVELYHMALYGNDKQTAAYQLCIIYFDYEGKYSSLDYVNIVLNGNNIKEKKEISLAILNSLYKYNIDEYSKLCLYIKALGCLLEIGEEQLIQYDIFKKLDLVFKQNRSKVSEQTIEEIKCLKEKFQNDEYKKSITNLYYKCIEYVYNRKIIEYDDSSYYEVIELLMNKYHNDKKVLDLIRQYESDLVRKYSSDNYDKTIECLTKLEKVDSSIASKKEKYILNHQKKLAIEVYFSEMRTNNADECIKEVQKTSLYKYLVRDKDALELNKRLNRASVYRYFNIANSQSCQYGCPYDKQCEKAKWYYYDCYKGNEIYHRRYNNDYNDITDNFIANRVVPNLNRINKKIITIVFVGCGNFYELYSIDKIVREYKSYHFFIVFIDKEVWPNNWFDSKYIYENTTMFFKKCDFYNELKKDYYNDVDIIYISRVLHYTHDSKKLNDLCNIIDNHHLTLISQVVYLKKPKSVVFENELRNQLDHLYHIFSKKNAFLVYKEGWDKYCFDKDKHLMISNLETIDNRPLGHYLYEIHMEGY